MSWHNYACTTTRTHAHAHAYGADTTCTFHVWCTAQAQALADEKRRDEEAKALAQARAQASNTNVKPTGGISDDQLKMVHKIVKQRLATQYSEIRTAFRAFDKDHSGNISAKECTEALLALNVGVPRKWIDHLVNIADYDRCVSSNLGGHSCSHITRKQCSFLRNYPTSQCFACTVMARSIIRSLHASSLARISRRSRRKGQKKKDSLTASARTGACISVHRCYCFIAATAFSLPSAGSQSGSSCADHIRRYNEENGITKKDIFNAQSKIRDMLMERGGLTKMFRNVDEDKSGWCSRAEMRRLVMNLNLETVIRPKVIEEIINMMDVDKVRSACWCPL